MKTFINVIRAIFIRELNVRTGNNKYAYLLLALEPLIPISFFAFLHSTISGATLSNEEYIVFLFSGFLIFNSFKNISLKGFDAIESNAGLFIYKQVKPIDTVFARFLTELFVFIISFILFIFIGYLFSLPIIPNDIFMVLYAYLLLFIFSISLSVFFAGLTLKYRFIKKVYNILFMPLLFLSAIFYSIKNMPFEYQSFLSYNPIALVMELIHHGWFEKINIVDVNFIYLFFWILIPFSLGLFFFNIYKYQK